MSICSPALDKCYADDLSYGEICVGCNCCGRMNSLTRGKSRLKYWFDFMDRQLEFDNWIEGLESQQKHNVDLNIKLAHKRIKYYQRYAI